MRRGDMLKISIPDPNFEVTPPPTDKNKIIIHNYENCLKNMID